MPETKERIFGYDLIKTLAIFLVVSYHVGGLDYGTVEPDKYYLPNFNKILSFFYAAGVPLFFMVNGALTIPRHYSFKHLLIKACRLVLLYVLGKFILEYLLCRCLLGIQNDMVHFWFLLTLAGIYLISYFLNKYDALRKILLCVLLICPFLTNFIGDIYAFFKSTQELPHCLHFGLFTTYSFFYYYLGDKLRTKEVDTGKCIFLILLGIVLIFFEVVAMTNNTRIVFDTGNAAFPTIGGLCMSLGLFLILKDGFISSESIKSVVTTIGKNTLWIYLIHVLCLFWLRFFFSNFLDNLTWIGNVTLSFLLIIICFLISFIIRKSSILGLLVCLKKRLI